MRSAIKLVRIGGFWEKTELPLFGGSIRERVPLSIHYPSRGWKKHREATVFVHGPRKYIAFFSEFAAPFKISIKGYDQNDKFNLLKYEKVLISKTPSRTWK